MYRDFYLQRVAYGRPERQLIFWTVFMTDWGQSQATIMCGTGSRLMGLVIHCVNAETKNAAMRRFLFQLFGVAGGGLPLLPALPPLLPPCGLLPSPPPPRPWRLRRLRLRLLRWRWPLLLPPGGALAAGALLPSALLLLLSAGWLAGALPAGRPSPRGRRGGRTAAADSGLGTSRPGTWTTRRSSLSSCRAVSLPPHTAPVSMACTPWVMVRPSADQWPQTIFSSRSTRPGTSNQGYRPWPWVPGVPLSSIAIRPRGLQ